MGSKCPKDTNRWAHFQGQMQWLLTHRARLWQWVVDKQPASSPSDEYWIIAAAINPLAKSCNVMLVSLQKRDLCLSQQTQIIEQLVQNLLLMVDIQHEDDNDMMLRDDRVENEFIEIGQWWVTHDAVFEHVKDQGT